MAKEKLKRMLEAQPNCYYCNEPMNLNYGKSNFLQATVDHVIPLSRGGPNNSGNRVLACKGCNWSKGPLTEEEYRERVRTGTVPKRSAIEKVKVKMNKPVVSRAERRRRKEAERIKRNPVKQASMPACLLWDH